MVQSIMRQHQFEQLTYRKLCKLIKDTASLPVQAKSLVGSHGWPAHCVHLSLGHSISQDLSADREIHSSDLTPNVLIFGRLHVTTSYAWPAVGHSRGQAFATTQLAVLRVRLAAHRKPHLLIHLAVVRSRLLEILYIQDSFHCKEQFAHHY